MRFDFDMINKIKGETGRVKISSDILDCKPPGGNSVIDVFRVFDKPMTTKEIALATGLSGPTVTLVLKFMRHYGDVESKKFVNTPTGTTKLLVEYGPKARPKSNTGVTGVTFVARTKTFHCCYGRKISIYYNNLLDAVCKRKSLELQHG